MSGDEQPGSVLVTGGSGYVAGWIIVDLLRRGWSVHTTVRDLARESDLRRVWLPHAPSERLRFFKADLLADAGWNDAAHGVSQVVHTASPMPVREYRTQDLIEPARAGTRRVIQAAHAAGARRIVMTSSTAAASPDGEAVHDEASWTDPNAGGIGNYAQAKTLVERNAWEMACGSGSRLALTTIPPAAIAGPVLGPPTGWSELLRGLIAGERPALPHIGFNFVHINDVVELHVRALTDSALAGQRIIAASDFLWFQEIAQLLRERYGGRAAKVPTRRLPDWVMRLVALFNVDARLASTMLGKYSQFNSDRARAILGRPLTPAAQTITDAADSVLACSR